MQDTICMYVKVILGARFCPDGRGADRGHADEVRQAGRAARHDSHVCEGDLGCAGGCLVGEGMMAGLAGSPGNVEGHPGSTDDGGDTRSLRTQREMAVSSTPSVTSVALTTEVDAVTGFGETGPVGEASGLDGASVKTGGWKGFA